MEVKPYRANEVIKILKKKGYLRLRCKGSHRTFANAEGQKVLVPISGNREIPVGTIGKIVKKLRENHNEINNSRWA